jgi:hypothetical protein
MTEDAAGEPIDHPAWPERTWLLMALGAAMGLAFHLLIRGGTPWSQTDDPSRLAGASFVAVSGVVFALSLERLRWAWAATFAAAAGLVVGGIVLWNGTPSSWGSDEEARFLACVLAVTLALPLFQALRDEGRLRLPVRPVHAYLWSNLILGAAAGAFVVATFLLTLLLSELFKLIGLHFLSDLFGKAWFAWMLGCGALGTALGILRDRDKVLGALQRVVRAVLSFLAPVLALGLVLFVAALPFTGLAPLWETTKSTTPILLFCVLGAVILANAAIGNAPDEEPSARALRWAAAALAAVMLPLAVVAALSTGQRIGQYGYTPDRLWAGVFVAVAAATATAYLVGLVRGRARWPDAVRRANVRVAAGISMLALFLALPIVSFGAISTRDQVARLSSGKVAPEKFDWAALRFDFGASGEQALRRLASGGTPAMRQRALAALKSESRYTLQDELPPAQPLRLTVEAGRPVPEPLRVALQRDRSCGFDCHLVFPNQREAILVSRSCDTCAPGVLLYTVTASGGWAQLEATQSAASPGQGPPLEGRRVEIREVRKRQIFVDGKPAGLVYDPPS